MDTEIYEVSSYQVTRKQGGRYWFIHLDSGRWLNLTTEYQDGRKGVTVFVDNQPHPRVLWKISEHDDYSAEIYATE